MGVFDDNKRVTLTISGGLLESVTNVFKTVAVAR